MKKLKKSVVHGPQSIANLQLTIDNRLSTILTLFIIVFAFACTQKKNQAVQEKYTCPMHPEIIRDISGTCPICFMDLVKVGVAENDGSIVLDESQIKLANISTAPGVKKEMEIKTVINGRIVVNEEETEVISSRVPGRVVR